MSATAEAVATPTGDQKITCQVCGERIHVVQAHLREAHPELNIEGYRATYPLAPLLSAPAQARLEEKRVASKVVPITPGASALGEVEVKKDALHTVFKLGAAPAARNGRGEPIPVSVLGQHDHAEMVPEIDNGYVWQINVLKHALMGLELNIPFYLWGHAGTGKSTTPEQIAARTNRPFVRVQHDRYTEPSHIVGQMSANEQGTFFAPGLLPLAMRNGWIYCADEYDYAMPGVLAVYQAVLEGKALVIREATPEWRIVQPHKNFRFCGTGNTNGAGDETDLYSGTLTQNYAQYSRFGIVEKVNYMEPENEKAMLMAKTGIDKAVAEKIVSWAGLVRQAFEKREVSAPVGPRELLYAAKLGVLKGNFTEGLKLSYTNKLPSHCAVKALEFAQRCLG